MRNPHFRHAAGERGFSLTELMLSIAITLGLMGAALTTFRSALVINDTASQLADTTQNLRAGTNQLIKDLMQAGRIIGPEGIPVPNGGGVSPIQRPSPPGPQLVFDLSTTTNLPDITTGFELGPIVNGAKTDIVTILTVDPFMPTIETPPTGATDPNEGTISPAGDTVTIGATSLWIAGDPSGDTPPVEVGDLVLFKNPRGMAIQAITAVGAATLHFDAGDWFGFNQRGAPQGTLLQIKDIFDTTSPWTEKTSLFRVMMITYYVDDTTTPGSPRLMRQINNRPPQALAGVVEHLTLTYDLVDGVKNPTRIQSLPYTDASVSPAAVYNSNQIRSVNVRAGVRSEMITNPSTDYVRNYLATSVDVRSLASVDRYVAQ